MRIALELSTVQKGATYVSSPFSALLGNYLFIILISKSTYDSLILSICYGTGKQYTCMVGPSEKENRGDEYHITPA